MLCVGTNFTEIYGELGEDLIIAVAVLGFFVMNHSRLFSTQIVSVKTQSVANNFFSCWKKDTSYHSVEEELISHWRKGL